MRPDADRVCAKAVRFCRGRPTFGSGRIRLREHRLRRRRWPLRHLRGAENHVAEQYGLFADRASAATIQATHVRMRFSPLPMFAWIPCTVSVCALLSWLMPPPGLFVATSSRSGRRCAPVCGAYSLPSPRDAQARSSSYPPTSTFSTRSVPLAPQSELKPSRFATRHADVRSDRLTSRATKSYHSRIPRTLRGS